MAETTIATTETPETIAPFLRGYYRAHAETLGWLLDIPGDLAAHAIGEVGDEKANGLIRYIISEELHTTGSLETLVGLLRGITSDEVPWCPLLLRHCACDKDILDSLEENDNAPELLEKYVGLWKSTLDELAKECKRQSRDGERTVSQAYALVRMILAFLCGTVLEHDVLTHYSQMFPEGAQESSA